MKRLGRIAIYLGVLTVIYGLLISVDGSPPDTSDLALAPRTVAESENGFTLVALPVNAVWEDQDHPLVDCCEHIFVDDENAPWNPDRANERIEHNAELLAAYAESLERPDFVVPPTTDFFALASHLSAWRKLALLLVERARLRTEAGDLRAAYDELIGLARFGSRVAGGQGPLLTFLVGLSLRHRAVENLRALAALHPPDEETFAAINAQLEELRLPPQALVDALRAEFDRLGETIALASTQGLDTHGVPSFLPFCINETTALFADTFRQYIRNAPKPLREEEPLSGAPPRGVLSVGSLEIPMPLRNVRGRAFYTGFLSQSPKTAWLHTEVDLAGTSAVLAVQQYRASEGKLPDDLEALVPRYLSRVPTDAYDGRPLRYSIDRGVVYSVGIDLKDDGGSGDTANETEPTFQIPGETAG